jgi:hypothetical protein
MKSKKLFLGVGLLTLVFLGLAVFYRPILMGAGQFLAPASYEKAEVLILEGTQIVKNGGMNAGMRLLSEGKAGHLVVVRYDTSHGFAHKDILHYDGMVDKQPLHFRNFNMAFTFAIQDLKTSWRWYKVGYEREIRNEKGDRS